jgi:hypothetical protein
MSIDEKMPDTVRKRLEADLSKRTAQKVMMLVENNPNVQRVPMDSVKLADGYVLASVRKTTALVLTPDAQAGVKLVAERVGGEVPLVEVGDTLFLSPEGKRWGFADVEHPDGHQLVLVHKDHVVAAART